MIPPGLRTNAIVPKHKGSEPLTIVPTWGFGYQIFKA
jgi:hypothetical protein